MLLKLNLGKTELIFLLPRTKFFTQKKLPRMIRNAKHSSCNHFSHSSPWKINAILREITFTAGKSSGYLSAAYARIYSILEIIAAHKKEKAVNVWRCSNGRILADVVAFSQLVAHIIDAFLRLVYHKRFSEPPLPPRFRFSLWRVAKRKAAKTSTTGTRSSHEIFKERYDTKSYHTLLTCYIPPILPFFHFIACWYCQIMSRVTLHNFWPTIVKGVHIYYILFFRKIVKIALENDQNCLPNSSLLPVKKWPNSVTGSSAKGLLMSNTPSRFPTLKRRCHKDDKCDSVKNL